MINSKTYQLKPFQEPGFNNLVTKFRHLLLYRMGLGKTVVTTKALWTVEARVVLILCPRNAIRVWEDHIKEWFDGLDIAAGKVTEETETSFHIWRWRKKYNNADARKKLWQSIDRGAKVNIYITTFDSFIRDHEHFNWKYDCLIIDEAKRIRSRKSKAFEHVKPIAWSAKYVWLLTGTPGRLPQHFWTMFNLIDRTFSSYWKFVSAFMYTQKAWGGMEVLGYKNEAVWHHTLARKATILTKKDVGHQETQRQMLWVEMDECQQALYKQMQEDMMIVGEGQILLAPTAMTQTLRYRQILVCPKILGDNYTVGAAFKDFVEGLKEGEINPHTVVFTPFTDAFPHFKEYLHGEGYRDVYTLSGGMDPDEIQERIDIWRKNKGIMLVSILFAQAFSLEPAEECYFMGREFNPEDNAQAEERLNRLTTTYPVNSYYYGYEDTYDTEQNLILDTKQRQENLTLKGITKK